MNLKDVEELLNKKKMQKARIRGAQRTSAVVGLLTAAGIAGGLLFAPKSGKKTRRLLRSKCLKMMSAAKRIYRVKSAEVKVYEMNLKKEAISLLKDVTKKVDFLQK
ncbi:MAG: YtxH domain-containing protein, partial [Pyrinomonadaceae bacterium]|nr:YtxH domain-containing protein [Sphingobacteriaceae bacterium]